jgi:hypothetical protein
MRQLDGEAVQRFVRARQDVRTALVSLHSHSDLRRFWDKSEAASEAEFGELMTLLAEHRTALVRTSVCKGHSNGPGESPGCLRAARRWVTTSVTTPLDPASTSCTKKRATGMAMRFPKRVSKGTRTPDRRDHNLWVPVLLRLHGPCLLALSASECLRVRLNLDPKLDPQPRYYSVPPRPGSHSARVARSVVSRSACRIGCRAS